MDKYIHLRGVFGRDEFELEFSGSSEPELWRCRAELSWDTSIFELIKNYNKISKFSTSTMIIINFMII